MKQEGNAHFRQETWTEALVKYQSGLGRLPKRPAKRKPKPAPLDREPGGPEADEDSSEAGPSVPSRREESEEDKEEAPPEEPKGLDLECAKARAVLNANIGACHMKLVSRMLTFQLLKSDMLQRKNTVLQ